jgi:hypothetical protein
MLGPVGGDKAGKADARDADRYRTRAIGSQGGDHSRSSREGQGLTALSLNRVPWSQVLLWQSRILLATK